MEGDGYILDSHRHAAWPLHQPRSRSASRHARRTQGKKPGRGGPQELQAGSTGCLLKSMKMDFGIASSPDRWSPKPGRPPTSSSSNVSKVSSGSDLDLVGQQSPKTKQRGGLVGWLFGQERPKRSENGSPAPVEDPYALPQDAMTAVERKRRQAMLERQVSEHSTAPPLSARPSHHKPVSPPVSSAIVASGASSPPASNVRLATRPLPHRPISQYAPSGPALPPIRPTMAVLSESSQSESSSSLDSSDASSNASQFDNLEELYTQVDKRPKNELTTGPSAKPRFTRQRRRSRRDMPRPAGRDPSNGVQVAYVPAGTHVGTLQRLTAKTESSSLRPPEPRLQQSVRSQTSVGSSRYGFEAAAPGMTAEEQRSLATVQRLLTAGDKRDSVASSNYGFDQQASRRSHGSSAYGFTDTNHRHSSGYGFSNLPTPQPSFRQPIAETVDDGLFNDEQLAIPTQHLPSEAPPSRLTSHHGRCAPPLPVRDEPMSSGATTPALDDSDSCQEGDDEASEGEEPESPSVKGNGRQRRYQSEAGYETVDDEPL